jgi:hypothetical protein
MTMACAAMASTLLRAGLANQVSRRPFGHEADHDHAAGLGVVAHGLRPGAGGLRDDGLELGALGVGENCING